MKDKKANRIPINTRHFKEVLKLKGVSYRDFDKDEAYSIIGVTNGPIRYYLKEGAMPPDLLDKIAKYLNVHPDYLSGMLHDKADRIEDVYLRRLSKKHLTAEKYPYILKAKSDIDYNDYFEKLLIMYNIPKEQFKTLPPEERVLFRQEMVAAIMGVTAKHFEKDALGQDTAETLSFYKSMVGDTDPFSVFANIEGIGLDEDEFLKENAAR